MTIKFLFTGINDIGKLYQSIRAENSEEKHNPIYIGDAYLRDRMDDVMHLLTGIQRLSYEQSFERFANEVFVIIANDHYYELVFRIDTYKDHKARMTVSIRTKPVDLKQNDEIHVLGDGIVYDFFLEQLKLAVKNCMRRDWAGCSWIMDDQSEQLCSELYPKIFRLENRIRAFANKILIRNLGQNWIELPGLEKYAKSRQKLSADFKRKVPCFSDIDDTFLSMTMESLSSIITEGKIYAHEIDWQSIDLKTLHRQIASGSANSVMEMIKSGRKIKCDIWEAFFKPHFSDGDHTKKAIEDFIKNRNHVAHNKLLNWDGYLLMKQNIEELDDIIREANESFENSFASEEEYLTWSIGTGNEPQEVYTVGTLDYLPVRIYGETGVKIRDDEEIFALFAETLDELYAEISDAYYFSTVLEVSEKYEIALSEDEQKVFSIRNLSAEEVVIDILADISFDSAMDGESSLQLSGRCRGEEQFSVILHYHNGSGAEDLESGRILLRSESVYDTEEIKHFKEELEEYLAKYM